jgi:hypothetical protein
MLQVVRNFDSAAQILAAISDHYPLAPSKKPGWTFLLCGVDVFLVSALFAFLPGLTAGVLLGICAVILFIYGPEASP